MSIAHFKSGYNIAIKVSIVGTELSLERYVLLARKPNGFSILQPPRPFGESLFFIQLAHFEQKVSGVVL